MYNTTNTYDIYNEKNVLGTLFFVCLGICCLMICSCDRICKNANNTSI